MAIVVHQKVKWTSIDIEQAMFCTPKRCPKHDICDSNSPPIFYATYRCLFWGLKPCNLHWWDSTDIFRLEKYNSDCSIRHVVAVVVIFYLHVQCIACIHNDSPCCLENGQTFTDSIGPPRWFMNETVTVTVLLLDINTCPKDYHMAIVAVLLLWRTTMAIHRITVALLPSVNDRSCKNQVGGLRSPQLSCINSWNSIMKIYMHKHIVDMCNRLLYFEYGPLQYFNSVFCYISGHSSNDVMTVVLTVV